MPKDLDLYFVQDDGTNEAVKTTLHTSCSKPIYSPYAVRLDDCETDGYPFYIDTSIIDIESMIDHPVLVFVDGTSRKSPTALFTNCNEDKEEYSKEEHCCKKGVSYLQVRVDGISIAGSLTVNATKAIGCQDLNGGSNGGSSSKKGGGSKSSSNGSVIRFVSCDDDCLDPFGTVECGESFDESPVSGDGDEVCFGSWNQETNRIDFGSKMPTNVELFFVPSDEDSYVVQSAYIHTSCSKPVYPNWATVFAEDCSSSDSSVVNLDNVASSGSLGLHVAFIDGVSPGYYQVAKELYNETGISYFDVNFADCGCNCDATGAPTISSPPTPGEHYAFLSLFVFALL
jgi:hypothetical protein